MTTTIIKYLPKQTSANTQYREIQEDDVKIVLNACVEILALMSQMDQNRDEDSRWVNNQWWHRRTDKLHRGREGQNTPCSMIGGLVHNFMFKDTQQRDFTAKQMEDLEYITNILHNIWPQIPALRFQIGLG